MISKSSFWRLDLAFVPLQLRKRSVANSAIPRAYQKFCVRHIRVRRRYAEGPEAEKGPGAKISIEPELVKGFERV